MTTVEDHQPHWGGDHANAIPLRATQPVQETRLLRSTRHWPKVYQGIDRVLELESKWSCDSELEIDEGLVLARLHQHQQQEQTEAESHEPSGDST